MSAELVQALKKAKKVVEVKEIECQKSQNELDSAVKTAVCLKFFVRHRDATAQQAC